MDSGLPVGLITGSVLTYFLHPQLANAGQPTVLTANPALSSVALLGVGVLTFGPLALKGIQLTATFLGSLSKSKKHDRIDSYNDQYDDKTTVDDRNKDYAKLVDSYYDLATEFYEWGWGDSFHFADRRQGETFKQSILRHEYYLAGRLGVSKGATVLDCGCGVGGPARNIARFTGANIKAITINQFQVDRGNLLSQRAGLRGQVELIQADFMKMPFPDNHFDAVYAIESTCHAPDRVAVYKEILRVLKPGGMFACYEWVTTDKYDANNEHHRRIKRDIEVGDGLPDLTHWPIVNEAVKKAGFELHEARDVMQDGHLEGGEPWYMPLVPSWNPTKWPRFQFNPIMFHAMPKILGFFELIRLVPKGTVKTQVMLQAGGVGCAQGGQTGAFTPAWLMVGRKPEEQ
jgi:sterol 24-C-methyltransferase